MQKRAEKFRGLGEDVLGAGFHILSGAGGDLKLLVQQAVARLMGDAYVSRQEHEALAARLEALETRLGKKPSKSTKSKPAKRPRK